MDESIEKWLKYAEGVVIECEEETISPHSLASVTPLCNSDSKNKANGQRIMTLEEALKINKRQIAKGDKLINYLKSRIGKSIFD